MISVNEIAEKNISHLISNIHVDAAIYTQATCGNPFPLAGPAGGALVINTGVERDIVAAFSLV